jgi:hypothetical protein
VQGICKECRRQRQPESYTVKEAQGECKEDLFQIPKLRRNNTSIGQEDNLAEEKIKGQVFGEFEENPSFKRKAQQQRGKVIAVIRSVFESDLDHYI